MNSEPGDVIANALLASNIIQADQAAPSASNSDEAEVKRLIPFSLPEGQVFYIEESPVDGSRKWNRDPLENYDFQFLGEGSQLCYIIPQECVYDSRASSVYVSSASNNVINGVDGTESADVEKVYQSQSVLSPTERSSPRWSEDKTKLLIALVKHYEKDFKGRLRPKGNIWQSIANAMSATYKDVDKDLCYKKWSNMLRTFRTFRKRNDRNWLYYEDIDKLSGSIETRCLTNRDIRKRMDALRYTKASIKRFLDRTSDMQERFHVCVSNFVQKLKVLQKQSDEHVETILSILEEHFCNKEVPPVFSDIAAQCNEMLVCENGNGASCDLSALPDLDIVYIPPDSPVEYQNSVPSEECNFQLVNECMNELEDSELASICNNQMGHSQALNAPGSLLTTSGFQDSGNRGTVWERLDKENSTTGKFPVIDLTEECMHEVIQVDNPMEPGRGENINDGSSEHQLFFTADFKDSDNFLPNVGQGISSELPSSQPSIDVNEPVHLIPQADGTFQFVSLSEHATDHHSQLFGSLKKMNFSTGNGSTINNTVSTASGIPTNRLSSNISTENLSPSESELVILSRTQGGDSEDSLMPMATTAVTFQLLPGADDSYQLVMYPQDGSNEPSSQNVNPKYADPWSFSVFTPICPILNVETTETGEDNYEQTEADQIPQAFSE